ncbi:MAG: rhodanese-like domain-containing protein [Pseudomonadota bacterium]|nr:rhodanese-like domain-containing protein [Pseudomonadota bacterium]
MKQLSLMLVSLLLLCARTAFADPIWIDVRSVEEHASSHIDGDTNIPLADIDAEALAARYGKDAELMLYCRSGNRAGQAQELLTAAGFTNVTNAGGIAEVRTLRGLPTQSPATAATGAVAAPPR